MAVQWIREAAEKAKIEPTQTEINFPFITADAIGPKLINTKLMRSQFESVVNPLSYPMNHRPMQKALSDAGVTVARPASRRNGEKHIWT